MNEYEYSQFIFHFKELTGVDLSLYKEEQMNRRLTNFIKKSGSKNVYSFIQKIKYDKKLLEETLDHITINVTEFFRNEKHWNVFVEKIVPIFKSKNRIKIWSAACSSGEEPYTIAMLLKKHFPTQNFDIIATDIDKNILKKANDGIYKFDVTNTIDDYFKNHFFQKVEENVYKIDDKVKKNVKFQQHNLLKDPFIKNADIIVCRNVLIYFTDDAKHKIYEKFSQSLNQNGVLFVGATEQILNPKLYEIKTLETFFYQKK